MRILSVHNYYRSPGGEDAVFAAEAALLRGAGHQVTEMTARNDEIRGGGLGLAVRALWNRDYATEVADTVRRERIDVVHFHNTVPIVSPASLRAASQAGAAVVMTLHNYRMACPAGTLFREGSVCEDCVGRSFPWAGVARGCYRDSRLASATVGVTNALHRVIGTWRNHVDRFVALTHFAKQKFEAAGIPAAATVVKPNFVADPGAGERRPEHALFVGRLAPEKGIRTFLEAAARTPDVRCRVVGDGPLASEVERAVQQHPNLTWLGWCGRERIEQELAGATCLVFPSQWYEGMPMTMLEAMAMGVPVAASRCGAMAEIVAHGRNGLLSAPGDAGELADVIRTLGSDSQLQRRLGHAARQDYEARYTPACNLAQLEEIYRQACTSSRQRRVA